MVERLVLKNLQQRPSQHVSWTPGARVMIIFLGLINRSLDRSIARATARSLDRSIARSIAQELQTCIDEWSWHRQNGKGYTLK